MDASEGSWGERTQKEMLEQTDKLHSEYGLPDAPGALLRCKLPLW